MAERWQQWMPHDIDAWQGSANVQALSDLAYRAEFWNDPETKALLSKRKAVGGKETE